MKFKYPRPDGFDVELNFYVNVLKLKSLHWGYWKDIKGLTLDNLKKAQVNYSKKVLSYVPKFVKNVLDVGAGMGDNAMRLAQKGISVTAVSPEPTQKEVFAGIKRKYNNVNFILSKYEHLKLKTKFDLILMSESSNYFPLKKAMKQTNKYLKTNGYLLVSGLFRKGNTTEYSAWNIIKDFEEEAVKNGLKLVRKNDITDCAAPTMQLANNFYSEHLLPFMNLLLKFYRKAFRWKVFLFSFLFRKEIQLAKRAFFKEIPERINVTEFKQKGRYLIYLFRKTKQGEKLPVQV